MERLCLNRQVRSTSGVMTPANASSLQTTSSFVLKVIRDALLIVDHEKLLFMNRALEEMCGTSSASALQNPSLLFPPEEFTAFFALVGRHLKGEQSSLIEAIVECQHGQPGGAPFLARVAFHPFNDEGGTRKCLCIFSEPLFYKPLFESASIIMAILEYCDEPRDCVFAKFNGAFGKFFSAVSGRQEKRHRASDLGLRFDDEDCRFFQQTLPAEPHVRLLRVIDKSPASERWLQATLTALGCSLKGRTLFTLVGEDVTLVAQLKEKLAQEKVLAQRQTVFFAKMVHELRTPISGMLGLTSLLRSTLLTAEQSDMLRTIQSCGDSVLSLVGNILDLSNLERNSVVLQAEPFNLLHCIEDALEIASSQSVVKHVSLSYEAGHLSHENVFGDTLRLRQVLLNLLTNAIKFSPDDGHVSVRIMEQQQSHSSILYSIAIQDDGIGIAEEAQARIFDTFTQADRSVMQNYGGSGLGLNIVKNLVALMGGTVQVQSEVSKGATFTLLIPFHPASSAPAAIAYDWKSLFVGQKALVVVQNAKIASNLCVRLGQLGLEVLNASAAVKANVLFTDNITVMQSHNMPTVILQHRDPTRAGPVVAKSHCVFLSEPIRRTKLVEGLCMALGIAKPIVALEEHRLMDFRKRRHRMGSPTLQRRILVVDDNLVNRKVTQQLLELLGYSRSCIYTASNGVEAIECLKQQVVDIVLMDLEMPVMDGLTATTEIRRTWDNHSRQVRIIACTAAATKEKRQQCLAVGMDGFLTKPLQREVLEEELGS